MQLGIFKLDNRVATMPHLRGYTGNAHFNWGRDNSLPQVMILNISNSPTATACTNKIEDFIYSGGITTPAFDLQVNEEQNLNSLYKEIAKQVSYFEAFALLVKRMPMGIVEVVCIPIENLRKLRYPSDGCEFVYNERFSEGLNDHNRTDRYFEIQLPTFKKRNGNELIEIRNKQIKDYGAWFGEVIFQFIPKPGSYLYPTPDWLSGLEDVQADISIMNYRLELLENGMMPSSIFSVVGEIDDSRPVNPETQEYEGKSEYEKFQENIQKMQGTGSRGKTMIFAGLENPPTFQTVDMKPTIEGVKLLSEIQPMQVARTFGVPDILVGGLRPGSLGNTQELEVSIRMFWHSLASMRSMIFDVFYKLYPNQQFQVDMFDPFGVLNTKQDG